MSFRRYKRRNVKLLYKIFIFFMVLLIIFVLMDAQVRPLVKKLAASQASSIATLVINDAINDVMEEEDVTYDDLVTIEYDSNENVTAIKTDIIKINKLKAKISTKISENLSKVQNRPIYIPLGSLCGNDFLTGRGPKINLNISLAGSATTQITNKLQSAGINQSLHQIMLNIDTTIYVVMSGANTITNVKTNVCIAQTVIVGLVPQTYADINGLSGTIAQK